MNPLLLKKLSESSIPVKAADCADALVYRLEKSWISLDFLMMNLLKMSQNSRKNRKR